MTSYNDSRTMLLLLAAVAAGLIGTCIPAAAQTVSLNYDRLSSLEEPLATEIGDVTLLLNGLVDTPMSLNLENDGAADGGVVGNFQASASTQLPNRWRVNLAYFGQYTDDPELTVDMNDNFKDNLALSVGGVCAGPAMPFWPLTMYSASLTTGVAGTWAGLARGSSAAWWMRKPTSTSAPCSSVLWATGTIDSPPDTARGCTPLPTVPANSTPGPWALSVNWSTAAHYLISAQATNDFQRRVRMPSNGIFHQAFV